MSALAAVLLLSPVADYGDVDALMERAFRGQRLPSLAYAVIEDGKIRHRRVWGKANLETEVPASVDTVYEIGSMTKQFTAAAILMLQEDGKLKVDDTLEQHLPNCPEGWKKITIRQALSHTAGLKDYLATFSPLRTEPVRSDEILAKMGPMPLDFTPGGSWSYSNRGYLAASLIVERYAAKSLEEFLKERIFAPLEMNSTSASQPDRVIKHRARGYFPAANDYRNAPVINPSLASGAGHLISNLNDLAKWEAALQSGKVFKRPETQAEFFREVALADGAGSGYALGWFVSQDRGRPLIEHGGNTVGFSVNLFRLPEEKLAVVTLTNGGGFGPAALNRRAVAMLRPSYDPFLRRENDPDPRQTASLAAMFRRWSRQNYDESMLAESLRGTMKTLRGTALRQGFVQIGKSLKAIRFLDDERVGGQRRARYAFDMGQGYAIIELGWSEDGKVADFDQLYAMPKTEPWKPE